MLMLKLLAARYRCRRRDVDAAGTDHGDARAEMRDSCLEMRDLLALRLMVLQLLVLVLTLCGARGGAATRRDT